MFLPNATCMYNYISISNTARYFCLSMHANKSWLEIIANFWKWWQAFYIRMRFSTYYLLSGAKLSDVWSNSTEFFLSYKGGLLLAFLAKLQQVGVSCISTDWGSYFQFKLLPIVSELLLQHCKYSCSGCDLLMHKHQLCYSRSSQRNRSRDQQSLHVKS